MNERTSSGSPAANVGAGGSNAPRLHPLVSAERARLFFQVGAPEGRKLIRDLHVLAVLGAAAVCLVVWLDTGLDWRRCAAWCSLIFVGEAFITLAMRLFMRRERIPSELRFWTWLKTVASTLNGMAWSLGPIFLYVPGHPVSVLAPVWGILNYTGAAVWDGAYFAPSIVAMLIGVTAPAAVWLFFHGGDIGFIASICLGVSLPFWMSLGMLSSRKMDEAIVARLEIADLLETQRRQTEQIVQAHRALREAHAERNRFFSAASHDLRQPLHALGFYVALMSRVIEADERRDVLNRLSECATSLDRQFNAIMGVADTDAAVEAASARSIPLQDLIDRVTANLLPDVQTLGLRLRVVKTTLWGQAAPELLERILANLVSNAIKYTRDGSVLVGAKRRGDHVDLIVADSGIGIAESDLPRIFDDFVQISNPERNREKGFGLGLGIVRRLCSGMGWPLKVTSRVGRGSVFSIRIPLATPAQIEQTAREEATFALADAPPAARSVLFVDDDELVRDAMGRLLSDWAFSVTLCANGAEAMRTLSSSSPNSRWDVVLDYRLAGAENGLAIADEIVRVYGDRVRIMMMSGETDNELLDGAKQRGITLLRKPVRPIRLRAALSAA